MAAKPGVTQCLAAHLAIGGYSIIHAVVDTKGRPLNVAVTGGQSLHSPHSIDQTKRSRQALHEQDDAGEGDDRKRHLRGKQG
jgi:hypothetical protein